MEFSFLFQAKYGKDGKNKQINGLLQSYLIILNVICLHSRQSGLSTGSFIRPIIDYMNEQKHIISGEICLLDHLDRAEIFTKPFSIIL